VRGAGTVRGVEVADGVTPDGSPVAVYRALPAEPEFTPLLDALDPPATVLDLGCGVGRLANVLAARGFTVTGVDESPAMLQHLDPRVETVRARLQDLRLGRRFDVVVLASHFVNVADEAMAHAFPATAAEHVGTGGRVYVEHYDAAGMRHVEQSTARAGPVSVAFRVLRRRGDAFDAEVTYRLPR
jgi:2-polyprenyl-3-methyl-5-hydroxy-6-metoxy-1,4-benzoquinol methylase